MAQGQSVDARHGVLLVGYGLAGRVFHAPLIVHEPALQLRSIVTSDPARVAQAIDDHPGVRVTATIDEALADAADIDLVVVASANRAHVSNARAAIAASKHVVVDKPLAGTAAQAQALAAQADAAGVQLHTFQNRRWDSDFLTLASVLSSGAIGTPHRVESRFERLRVEPKGGWRESSDPMDLGGVLLDFGAHLVDQALMLLGPVSAVDAYARSLRDPGAGDDDMMIVLTHVSGAVSLLVGSQVSAFSEPRFTALGTRGGLRIGPSDSQEERLRAGSSPSAADWGAEAFSAELVIIDADGQPEARSVPMIPGDWPRFYAQVGAAISAGSAGPVPITDVIANLRVLEAAARSSASRARIRLDPPASHA